MKNDFTEARPDKDVTLGSRNRWCLACGQSCVVDALVVVEAMQRRGQVNANARPKVARG